MFRIRTGGRNRRGGGVIGLILVLGAAGALFWNEGRSAQRLDALAEGRAAVATVDPGRADPAYEGRLVHLVGPAEALETVRDSTFGVDVTALRLDRIAHMYQWDEDRRTNDGRTTYSYDRVWSSSLIDSRRFHRSGYDNPSQMEYRSRQWTAPVRLGGFRIDAALIAEMEADRPLAVRPGDLPQGVGPFQAGDEWLYTGTPGSPQVGDQRIRFVTVPEQTVSLVALQSGGGLAPYTAGNGEVLALIEAGQLSAAELFSLAEWRNTLKTWAIRAGGAFAMFLGFALAMTSLTRWLPVFRDLATGAAMMVSALLAGSLSLIVVAVGWLVYRPVMAVGLLVGGAVLAVGLPMVLKRGRRAETGPAMPPPPPAEAPPPPPRHA
jgi:hypothetical protein